ncbi:hypothetical protein MWU38_03205 [Qipengyuania sp. S6317L1]|uniref:hypothetical protein n=1 Tax=Qipengyuania sp. S6317L1 TaxID=2926410 RepID=UPI001FF21881|nr:hypothetical protein [Qipengyuania sp. S6317L1]MCK0098383.1 hypothetical protein [Qipengyuania sp. S6317L1]
MKINIFRIVIDHMSTLRNARNGYISITDLFVFYIVPVGLAVLAFWSPVVLEDSIFSQSIAVFSIFSALLFSVQIALFGIFSKSRAARDEYDETFVAERVEASRKLISETNSNISYLIVLSAISVTLFLAASVFDESNQFESAFAVFLYSHFMLTLLMVIKRVHALFAKEYEQDEPHV